MTFWPWATVCALIEVSRFIDVVPNLFNQYKLAEFFNSRDQVGSIFIKKIYGNIKRILSNSFIVDNLVFVSIKLRIVV